MPKFSDLANEYASLWNQAIIRPEHAQAVATAAEKLQSRKPNYDQVSARTNVPWYIVGLIHGLEDSTFSITTHLHNGDPLTARTVHVPADRPKTGFPPFNWVDSAVDALTIQGFTSVSRWSIERIAFQLESYNGWGYRKFNIRTPYLWSFTNLYLKGKYGRDREFDPSLVSDQPGAMALLKQLVAGGLSVPSEAGANGAPPLPPPMPLPPPVPVPTGLYFADGAAFTLLAEPRDDAARGFRILTNWPITKLKEVDATWWQIEAIDPDNVKHSGFTHRDWLKAQTVSSGFDSDEFAQACLDAARAFGTSAHFLLALAQVESGMANKEGNGGAFGPFALTASDWTTYNDPAKTGAGDDKRFDPLIQPAVAALMTVKLTDELRTVLLDKRLPTSEELYLARIFGSASVPKLLAAARDAVVRDVVLPPLAAADVDRIFACHSALLPSGVKAQDLRNNVQTQLDAGLDQAVKQILKLEPDLVIGPPATAGDSDAPWMVKAKAELAKNIKEFPGGASNPEIEKYFTDTTLHRQPDDVAWCAAFVSWCIKESGGSQKPVTYSARAADWLKNGEGLSGPAYGAVAVMKPYAAKSSGHVGFVSAWDETKVTLLGGNQGDEVCEKGFPIADVRGWRMM